MRPAYAVFGAWFHFAAACAQAVVRREHWGFWCAFSVFCMSWMLAQWARDRSGL